MSVASKLKHFKFSYATNITNNRIKLRHGFLYNNETKATGQVFFSIGDGHMWRTLSISFLILHLHVGLIQKRVSLYQTSMAS